MLYRDSKQKKSRYLGPNNGITINVYKNDKIGLRNSIKIPSIDNCRNFSGIGSGGYTSIISTGYSMQETTGHSGNRYDGRYTSLK